MAKMVFAADRHGREEMPEGEVYIGAGDEIYTQERGEGGGELESYESGVKGNAGDEQELTGYLAGEIEDRLSKLSEEYDEVHLTPGNHEAELIGGQGEFLKQVASKYDNVEVHVDEVAEIEGRNFYFAGSWHRDPDEVKQVADMYQKRKSGDLEQISALETGYEDENLEDVANALDKQPDEVSLGDVEAALDGEMTIEEESSNDSAVRNYLEEVELLGLGENVFQPLYGALDSVFGRQTEEKTVEVEQSEEHEALMQSVGRYTDRVESTVSKIDEHDSVTYVGHGPPANDKSPGSVEAADIIAESEAVDAAYVGHIHGGFDGERETQFEGTPVINPMEGYTIDESGGALEDGAYETRSFEGDKRAEADPVDVGEPPSGAEQEGIQGANEIRQMLERGEVTEQEAREMLGELKRRQTAGGSA